MFNFVKSHFRGLLVALLLTLIVFIVFRDLFSSYFEADEWYHFTYYFPLVRKPDGLLTAVLSTFFNTGALSGGQHVVPIASLIFFLNAKFFGLFYPGYAFMSLFFHALDSFLIFVLIYISLQKNTKCIIVAFMGSIFFALSPTPLHTITGAAPFYGQNILSVTFFISCLIAFKWSFIKKETKYIYLSILFLFSSIFTKETSVFIFALLPIMALMEKRIFSLKFLSKLLVVCIIIFAFFRFVLPTVSDHFINNSKSQLPQTTDANTIVSNDLSIYKNLPGELIIRSITFPMRMIGNLFVPRQTVLEIVKVITPIMVPVVPGGDTTPQIIFLYGSGNYFVIYLFSIGIIIFLIYKIKNFVSNRKYEEARIIFLGSAIIVLSALPLVAIVFSFPRWGYDFYFDSRFYYNPNVGAAVIFPFLLFSFAKLLSKLLRSKREVLITIILFFLWLIYNNQVLSLAKEQFINKHSSDRREVAEQIKKLLPVLPQKTVFYFETDGFGAYGPMLPFQTSVPQALSIIYFDRNPLPDSFFNKFILGGKPEGYQYADGRGFGYYTSKTSLTNAVVAKKFDVDNIYSFYYFAEKVKLVDRTDSTRDEMRKYLKEKNE